MQICNWRVKFWPSNCADIAGLFEMIVRVLTNANLVLQMQPRVISLYVVTSRIRFMFLLFPQASRNWRYESEPPLKLSPLTCYKQFGTNSIIVLMFVESQRVHIQNTCKVHNKTWSVVLLNKKKHLLLSQAYYVWQAVKTPTIISNNPVYAVTTVRTPTIVNSVSFVISFIPSR